MKVVLKDTEGKVYSEYAADVESSASRATISLPADHGIKEMTHLLLVDDGIAVEVALCEAPLTLKQDRIAIDVNLSNGCDDGADEGDWRILSVGGLLAMIFVLVFIAGTLV